MAERHIFVLNGPNLNLLGTREPEHYGHVTIADLERTCRRKAEALGLELVFRQTNGEGELVSWIQEARAGLGLVLNAGAYTHTSVAVHDALRMLGRPCIEVHLSNIYARESFRHRSYVSPVVSGVICGLGARGYEMAIEAIADLADPGEAP